MSDSGWLIVGLGNPGPAYVDHRHNVGHHVVETLAARIGGRFKSLPRARADVVEGRLGGVPGVRACLAKPRCYMNESGGPVKSLAAFYKIEPDGLIVIHDELDLPFGSVRLKYGGGDNGHNGLRSIRRSLGTGDYYRIRVGVDRPSGRQSPADYVLSPFSTSERKDHPFVVDRVADAIECLVIDGLETAQNQYHAGSALHPE